MNLVNRSATILLALSLSFASTATSQVLSPELTLPDNYSPENFAAILSSIGNAGKYSIESTDNVALENSGATGQLESDGDVSTVEAADSSAADLATSFAEDLQFNQGAVVESSGLTQVVASNTITSSVSGNRVEVSDVVEGENRIVDSFNNVHAPINYSQNSGFASSVSQQITVQVGIEIPSVPVAQ